MNFIVQSKKILSNNKNIMIKVSGNLKRFKIISPSPLDDETREVLQTYGNYIMVMITNTCDSLVYFNEYYKKIKINSENMGDIKLAEIISKHINDCINKIKTVVDISVVNDSEVYFIEKESSFYQVSQTFRV